MLSVCFQDRGKHPTAHLLVQACQHLWLVEADGERGSSLTLVIPPSLAPHPRRCSQMIPPPHGIGMARRPGCIVPAASHRTVTSPACAGRLLTTERQVLPIPSPFSFEQLFRRLHVAPIRASRHRSTPAWSRARTAKGTTSSGPAATATEAGHLREPRSPERGFVMLMPPPPVREHRTQDVRL